jgi:uncharacterized protein (TIGR02421 family)
MLQAEKVTDTSKRKAKGTSKGTDKPKAGLSPQYIASICKRLEMGKPVKRTLPVSGQLHIERQLPFLCVYRQPMRSEDKGTEQLLTGQASYLIVPDNRRLRKEVSMLVQQIATTLQKLFGSFLVLEIWALEDEQITKDIPEHKPVFRIIAPRRTTLSTTITEFEEALHDIRVQGVNAEVEVAVGDKLSPPGSSPLLSTSDAARIGCHLMGIAIRPVYRHLQDGPTFPVVLRSMRRRVTHAFQRGFFDFVNNHTHHRPPHFQALGPRAMKKIVWQVDKQLAVISGTFDFLLDATPINITAAWSAFKRSSYNKRPEFIYRRLAFDPIILKRKLFKVPTEEIEDPTLAHLFLRQQLEIDRKITMLQDRGKTSFLYGSLQAYGPVDDELLTTATAILEQLPGSSREATPSGAIDAKGFAVHANEELDYLRRTHPGITSTVEIRDDVVGLLVSRGNLLIGTDTRVPVSRIKALLAHELGTHVITYLNGMAQPFRQLYVGLPGYDELQEGLAVLAEYLVGGLSRPRMRLLAARVVAVHKMINGASFIDVYRDLTRTYEFPKRIAFSVTTRIFRGGGLTKDAVYLRGLIKILQYLQEGGRVEPLYAGKFAIEHLPLIEELQIRHILGPAPLRPTYLDDPTSLDRLDRIRQGATVMNLIYDINI